MSTSFSTSALAIRRNFKIPNLFIDINLPYNIYAPIPPPTPDKRSVNYNKNNIFKSYEEIEEQNWIDLLCSAK